MSPKMLRNENHEWELRPVLLLPWNSSAAGPAGLLPPRNCWWLAQLVQDGVWKDWRQLEAVVEMSLGSWKEKLFALSSDLFNACLIVPLPLRCPVVAIVRDDFLGLEELIEDSKTLRRKICHLFDEILKTPWTENDVTRSTVLRRTPWLWRFWFPAPRFFLGGTRTVWHRWQTKSHWCACLQLVRRALQTIFVVKMAPVSAWTKPRSCPSLQTNVLLLFCITSVITSQFYFSRIESWK